MSYTTEEKLEILRKRLQEVENEISRIRQLRPLLDLENGWSEPLSFEVMSDIVVEWLEDHNIKTKADFEKHTERR